MAKLMLILTCDYEVWGDGSGCVENCVINPSKEMMDIVDPHKIPITFFWDVCEYWAFEKIESEGRFEGSYLPATLMRNQLLKAVENGHDVQLHFHPQWLNYKFISNHRWKLDYRLWRLPNLTKNVNDNWSLNSLFEKGISTLNSIFQSVNNDYRAFVFRAGAWSIQPEDEVIMAMEQNSIRIDSTFAYGRKFDDGITYYDFTEGENGFQWKVGDKIGHIGSSDITEVPIFTIKTPMIKLFYYNLLRILKQVRNLPEKCARLDSGTNGSNLWQKIKKQKDNRFRMLNFSDATTFQEMRDVTNAALKRYKMNSKQFVPVVAISHSKTFGNRKEFKQFIEWAVHNPNIQFGTYKNVEL